LKSVGIEVVLANNGQESLDILDRDSCFDCILMDCQMPVMDGHTATRAIRQNPTFINIPIIALTANAMLSDQQKVIESGMNDHIAKPIVINQMFTTLSKWIMPKNTADLVNLAAIDNKNSVDQMLAGIRILLVEDNEMLQELAKEMLSDAGAEVVLASNGQESLDILDQDANFDYILMDCQMPVMDGPTAALAIRQNPALKNMIILAVTGSVSYVDEKMVRDYGMNGYIAKPYTIEEIIVALKKMKVVKTRAA